MKMNTENIDTFDDRVSVKYEAPMHTFSHNVPMTPMMKLVVVVMKVASVDNDHNQYSYDDVLFVHHIRD